MSLTLATPVSLARTILNDTDVNAYRYSAADLLQYANDALDQMVSIQPSLFHAEGEIDCLEGTLQSVSYDDARALVQVRRIKDGPAVLPCSKDTLDAFNPSWHIEDAGPAQNWMGVENDPVRFLVYPPASQGQTLEVIYVKSPPIYALNDQTGLPDVYADAVADYIVYRAESRDDEHINTQRAQAFLASFVQKVSGA